MGTATIYGASDDLIEVEGDVPGCDEYNEESAHFVLHGTDGRAVRIKVWYASRGVWAIGAAPLDEDIPMLPLALDGERYTARAVVEGVTSVVHEAA